jgi:hypothetical protein
VSAVLVPPQTVTDRLGVDIGGISVRLPGYDPYLNIATSSAKEPAQ